MSSNSTNSKIEPKRCKPRPQPTLEVGGDRSDDTQSFTNDESTSANDKPKLKSSDVTGLKYFAMLAPLLERLHNDQCQRDKANQRDLHYDQYCMLILLYLFNPTVTSLRAIEQAIESLPDTIYRVKGFLYLEELPAYRFILQMVGKRSSIRVTGQWEPESPRSEIVVIGTRDGIDDQVLQPAFDTCVGTGDEFQSPILRLARKLGLNRPIPHF